MKNKKKYYQKFDHQYYSTDGYDDYKKRFLDESIMITIPTLCRILRPKRHWSFLDVGCSFGGNIIALRELGFEAKGTEISTHCLKSSPVKEHLCFGECFDLPFEDNHFDVSMCFDVFMYLNEDEVKRAVEELVRVASRFVVFSTIDNTSPNATQEHNPDELRHDSVHLFSKQDYIELFEKTGARLFSQDFFPSSWDFSAIFEV
jgi:SAM-dependent methyltransferase